MTVLLLLAVVVLVLLNGFFVAAEFALVRVRRARIEEDAENGVRGARRIGTLFVPTPRRRIATPSLFWVLAPSSGEELRGRRSSTRR